MTAASTRVVRPSDWERDVRDRIIARDDTVLTEVYDQFSSFVYGLALRVIGDPRAAEDVSQDVFVGIWQRPRCVRSATGQSAHVARHAHSPAGGRLRPA